MVSYTLSVVCSFHSFLCSSTSCLGFLNFVDELQLRTALVCPDSFRSHETHTFCATTSSDLPCLSSTNAIRPSPTTYSERDHWPATLVGFLWRGKFPSARCDRQQATDGKCLLIRTYSASRICKNNSEVRLEVHPIYAKQIQIMDALTR